MLFDEAAPAKINLTLKVLGRRADGYHELESVVTFADIGDRVTLLVGPASGVATSGPFATAIDGENLLEVTLRLLQQLDPQLQLGAVALEKNLPVAAGMGGGSADAAALLRAVRRANPERGASVDWHAVARRLGADVPVCLASVPAVIRGVGDRIEPLDGTRRPPKLAAVLVNPRIALPTAEVFEALASGGPARPFCGPAGHGRDLTEAEALISYMRTCGNDLERAATSLRPIIADVKTALAGQPGCRIAAMTGSGATCYGVFADDTTATAAEHALRRAQPEWWIAATRLG